MGEISDRYRAATQYRSSDGYRRGFRSGQGYRSGLPYRNPGLYRGHDTATEVPPPGVASRGGLGWGLGLPDQATAAMPSTRPTPQSGAGSLPWGTLDAVAAPTALASRSPLAEGGGVSLPWEETSERSGSITSLPIKGLAAAGSSAAVPWEDTDLRESRLAALRWSAIDPRSACITLPWQRYLTESASASLFWRRIAERGGFVALPWSPIAARSSSTVIVWPPTPPVDENTILVPDLPVYVMLPTMTAVRLPDRTPLPLLSISLQEERGGYTWSFSAPMRREGLALVNPDDGALPEIEVTINGYVWTLVVEAYDDNRRFGSNTVSLRGYSPSALLAAPHAPTRTYTAAADRTAAQLADEELPPGWTLVWDAVDWLVPGGTFSYADLAPIEAIARLASAIGASIESDPAARRIRVAPGYPESPWEWASKAPYAVLPAGVLASGSSTWKGGTNADGVYVYAQNAGSGAFVKLAGSAGAVQVPMVVDPLLVHADAQRERGRQELAAAGRARTVQRTVPLFPTPAPEGMPELGVVRTGVLLEVQDTDETWVGMVVGVRIDAQRQGRALSVRQHLTIERQYR